MTSPMCPPMTSYAQNYEDVMLRRALRDVSSGFYVDVGANDPTEDSVTRHFYEHGWHGINIEPLSAHCEALAWERPRDINLCCAAGSETGELSLWECDVRGWATADAGVVRHHQAAGKQGWYRTVPVMPLDVLLERHAPEVIHFLKIDVEGHEKAVLEGLDLTRFRPWIILAEATRPNSTEEVHHLWEGRLLEGGYTFVYADGINRFYLAEEQEARREAFRYPPNFFDGFQTAREMYALIRAEQAERQLAELRGGGIALPEDHRP